MHYEIKEDYSDTHKKGKELNNQFNYQQFKILNMPYITFQKNFFQGKLELQKENEKYDGL